ncbi:MFS transporter [Amycolatopsis sp. SID8362]|uniref:MFS transporter n=1 Tax=Amycolatopsis sp. SID8362 TaxID=2690346 RepID=UPI0035C88092
MQSVVPKGDRDAEVDEPSATGARCRRRCRRCHGRDREHGPQAQCVVRSSGPAPPGPGGTQGRDLGGSWCWSAHEEPRVGLSCLWTPGGGQPGAVRQLRAGDRDAARHFGVSVGAIGWLSQVFPLIYVLLAIPAGIALDRFLRPALIAGAVLTAAGAFLRLVEDNYTWAFTGQVVAAVGQPLILNAIPGLAVGYLAEKSRTAGIAAASSATFGGMVLGVRARRVLTRRVVKRGRCRQLPADARNVEAAGSRRAFRPWVTRSLDDAVRPATKPLPDGGSPTPTRRCRSALMRHHRPCSPARPLPRSFPMSRTPVRSRSARAPVSPVLFSHPVSHAAGHPLSDADQRRSRSVRFSSSATGAPATPRR